MDTNQILKTRHHFKTYSDLGRASYGEFGYTIVSTIIFLQQISVVTSYFFYLNGYFPAYIVLVGLLPICMF